MNNGIKIFLVLTNILSIFYTLGQEAIITGVVADQFGDLPGAKIAIEGDPVTTSTDVNGAFLLTVKPGEYRIKASFVMYSPQNELVSLEEGDSVYIDFVLESGLSIDEEVAVGTRSKPRTLLETTVPIDIIPQSSFQATPHVELSQVLNNTAASFHSTYQTISDGTDFIDPATLRGLGPDQVLVLINGKRRHTSSLLNVNGTIGRGSVGTDFNAIPIGAIDRVEILRDGAAAQYGSDAIAGVINVILKDQIGVTQMESYYGKNTEGDGRILSYWTNTGFDIGESGFVNMTVELRDRNSINRSGDYTGAVYVNDNAELDRMLVNDRYFFSQTGFNNRQVMEVGGAGIRNLSFFVNTEIPISDLISFYGHAGRSFRNGRSRGLYRFPKDSARVVSRLYPDGFSPIIAPDIEDKSLTVGFKGIKNNWNIDLSNTNGANQFDFNVLNSNNASFGDRSPTEFYSGGFSYSQNTTNVDVSRTLNWLEGVNLAFGIEMRLENYQIHSGDGASWMDGGDTLFVADGVIIREPGVQVFPGFRPENELNKFRTNNAAYIDIESFVNEKFLVGLAGRYESYSDFGSQGTWKVSGRYKPEEWLSFSAGLSTGFRAPSLHQVYFNNISTQFVDNELIEISTFQNERARSAFLIGPLKPELSTHFTAGLTYRSGSRFTLSLNYYSIIIEDRIVLSGSFSEGFEFILEPLNVDQAQFFTNAIDTKTTGADLVISYKLNTGVGEFNSSISANVTSTQLNGPVKTTGALEGQESLLFDRGEIGRIENAQPSSKIILLNSYKQGHWSVILNSTFFGEIAYIHPYDGDPNNWRLNTFTGEFESRDQTFSPKIITDLSFSWQFSNNIRLTVGSNNLFDVYPDRQEHSFNVSDGLFPYSRWATQFPLNGTHYFCELSLKL